MSCELSEVIIGEVVDMSYWDERDWATLDNARFEAKCQALLKRQIGPRTIFPVSETVFSSEERSSWFQPEFVQVDPKPRNRAPWIIGLTFAVIVFCFGLMFMTYYLQKGF